MLDLDLDLDLDHGARTEVTSRFKSRPTLRVKCNSGCSLGHSFHFHVASARSVKGSAAFMVLLITTEGLVLLHEGDRRTLNRIMLSCRVYFSVFV